MTQQETTSALSRPLLAAVGLAVVLAIGVAGLGLWLGTGDPTEDVPGRTGPLALVSIDAPDAGSPPCTSLVEKLPVGLPSGKDMLPRREIASPAPPATVAWGDAGHDPVVLRCGLPRPAELSATSQLRVISDVQWLQLPGSGSSTWVIVDRGAYVALTVPDDAGTGPLQDISTTVRDLLPKQPIRTSP
ncbi:Protein of unknown function [Lentzea xinjiangensis]|uniref:DUF3515 domain-containing protein n=1 Tax=Lentzea xinjiangensis TaxID=402600 RepID=A0A1H9Q040_9PSEU|nr:DUF3515 domain-containing protein [Lentzea xinjiangensis]SER53916.1 Protein of unknown function [Lentzea xinjiangensis]